jgi:hypothetical protein
VTKPLSAVDSISPAFVRTKQMLFQPFRFGMWARLAVVSVVTGEFASGGGSSGNFSSGSHEKQWSGAMRLLSEPVWKGIQDHYWLLALGGAVLGALFLLWVYCDSVFRFILLDAVLSGRYRLREGWRRWRSLGRRFFLWSMGFTLVALVLLGITIGVPVLLAIRAGWFEKPDRHIAALIGGGLLLFLLVAVLVIALAVTDLLARDFVIPMMALESVGILAGWRRLVVMLRAEKLACGGYVLMKVVLAVGCAILFTIVDLVVVLVLMIPLGLVGVSGFFIGKSAGLSWNIPTILSVVAFGILTLAGIIYVVGFVYAPGLVFFQSFALEFLGSRHPTLASKMAAGSQPQVPPAEPWSPPETSTA